ncbi:MAG TPA: hypothetical protein VK184_17480 [Nostocaceae cyanobacterium]|nr:hypothetical protein [Nostocaceae cyanobacterium]
MQSQKCKYVLLTILSVFSCGQWCYLPSRVFAANLPTETNGQKDVLSETLNLPIEFSQIDIQPAPTTEPITETGVKRPEEVLEIRPDRVADPLDTQINDVSQPSPVPNTPELNQLPLPDEPNSLSPDLDQEKQPSAESVSNEEIDPELGLRVRPRPLEQISPPEGLTATQFKPIGFLKARLGYFHSSNIFSELDNPTKDGLIFSGLTLSSVYFPLSKSTFINGSIDGNLIRYLDESEFNYNQLRFNLSLYQQLSRRSYGEIRFSNQQLFYANSSEFFQGGDRFLNENAVRLSLGRRDPLTDKLKLDTAYELSLNFSDPARRSRVINSLWVGLSYDLAKPLQASLNYQLNLTDFSESDRYDQWHRVFGNLNYRVSETSNLNLQTGFNLGDSTDSDIDFDGWFFSVNYNLELGRF